MSNTTDQLLKAFEIWEIEDKKFVSGNNSAGTRSRKMLQEISKLVKLRRSEISAEKIARKEAKQ